MRLRPMPPERRSARTRTASMVIRHAPPRLRPGVNVSWQVAISSPPASPTINSLFGSASIASNAAQVAASTCSGTTPKPRARLMSSSASNWRIAGTSNRSAERNSIDRNLPESGPLTHDGGDACPAHAVPEAYRGLVWPANSPRTLILEYAILILTCGTLYHFVEHRASYGDARWWAIVTASTVGYGDISPATWEG